MKTPEEIKKGLECCMIMAGCAKCPYRGEKCALTVSADALAYIQQLEQINAAFAERTAQLESELAAPYRRATMKEVAEYLKRMGIDCYYGEE